MDKSDRANIFFYVLGSVKQLGEEDATLCKWKWSKEQSERPTRDT